MVIFSKGQGTTEPPIAAGRALPGQGAIELPPGPPIGRKGQGATEYLVLLAVVLIIALVSIALLGFMPEFARDATMNQLDAAWKSAYPISIVESGPSKYGNSNYDIIYFRVRNVGGSKIKIVNLLSGNASTGTNSVGVVSDFYNVVLSPGEEACFSYFTHQMASVCGANSAAPWGTTVQPLINTYAGSLTYRYLKAMTSKCSADNTGYTIIPDFGFEYYEYHDSGATIKKKQWGQDLMMRCQPS